MANENEKISIIVPVYGVERWLGACLDSIAAQTHGNIEAILVDDGSPDKSGAICDGYAARDSRFKVIHQQNAGVAAARNTGLKAATGDWIGFVDPDDWVEPGMFECLLGGAKSHGADVAVCGRIEERDDTPTAQAATWQNQGMATGQDSGNTCMPDAAQSVPAFENGINTPGNNGNGHSPTTAQAAANNPTGLATARRTAQKAWRWDTEETLTRDEAIARLVDNTTMGNYLWDKLWRRGLWQGIWFPEGHTYEDIRTVYRLFLKCGKVACLPDVMYHYRQHGESIVRNTRLKNRMDYLAAVKGQFNALSETYPGLRGRLLSSCVEAAMGVWCCWYFNPAPEREAMLPVAREAAAFCREHMGGYEPGRLGLAGKLALPLTKYAEPWAFALAALIGAAYKRKNGQLL